MKRCMDCEHWTRDPLSKTMEGPCGAVVPLWAADLLDLDVDAYVDGSKVANDCESFEIRKARPKITPKGVEA